MEVRSGQSEEVLPYIRRRDWNDLRLRSDNCRLFDHIDLRSLENGSADRLLPGARDTGRFSRHAAALDTVEARAREALREPLPTLPWSLFRLFRDTGNRRLYETPYFERRRRLADLQVCLLAGRDSDETRESLRLHRRANFPIGTAARILYNGMLIFPKPNRSSLNERS